MRKRAHSTLGTQKHAVNEHEYWAFQPGDEVVADGFPGKVTAVLDGPVPGNEYYQVELSGGHGGGEYTANQLAKPSSLQTQALDLNFWRFRIGERVLADGYTGYISKIVDLGSPTDLGHIQSYEVVLDKGLGAHVFTAPQLTKLAAEIGQSFEPVEASSEVLASHWYPELGSILVDRPPNERIVVEALRKTAATEPLGDPDTDAPEDHPDVCSWCGNPGPWIDEQDTGRGTRIRCGTCGGTMRRNADDVAGTSGIQWQPENSNSPENHASRQGDPRATIDTLDAVHGSYTTQDFADNVMARLYLWDAHPEWAADARINPAATQEAGYAVFHAPRAAQGLREAFSALAADQDDETRLQVTATWREVVAKAKRIRDEDGVRILAASTEGAVGEVRGDTATYETAFNYVPGTRSVGFWACGCKWGSWANTERFGHFKRFQNRACSHNLALRYAVQSKGMFGREVTPDPDRLEGQYQRSPVQVEYQRPANDVPGRDITRRSVPPGNMRTQWHPKSRVRVKGSLHGPELTPAHEWARLLIGLGTPPSEVIKTLHELTVPHALARDAVRYATSSEASSAVVVEGRLRQIVAVQGEQLYLDDGSLVPAEQVRLAAAGDDWSVGMDPERRRRAEELGEKLWKGVNEIFDPGGTDESRASQRRMEGMNHLLNLGYHPHEIVHSEEDEPYATVHHPSGWYLRDHGDPNVEIYHRATGDDAHEMLDVGDWSSHGHIREPGAGPVEMKRHLDHWVDGDPEETGGAREYLEQHDPRIRRWKASRRAQLEHYAFLNALAAKADDEEEGSATAYPGGGTAQPGTDIPEIETRDQTERKKDRKHLLHHTNDAREHATDYGFGVPWGATYTWCDQCNGSGCGHCNGVGQVVVGNGLPQDPSDLSTTENPVSSQSVDAGTMIGDSDSGMNATGSLHTADWAATDLGPTYPATTNEQITPGSSSTNPGSTGFATSADPTAWNNPIMNTGYFPTWEASLNRSLAAAQTGKPPTVAGVALKAADTGRLLMIQRSRADKKDPARGTWEFPGGHLEEGDQTSLHGAIREWEEEVGQPFPSGGHLTHVHRSGPYVLHTVVIPEEKAVDFSDGRATTNPDDPDGDDHEQSAWWEIEHARKNPALRTEVKSSPWAEIKKAAAAHRPQNPAQVDYSYGMGRSHGHRWAGEQLGGRHEQDPDTAAWQAAELHEHGGNPGMKYHYLEGWRDGYAQYQEEHPSHLVTAVLLHRGISDQDGRRDDGTRYENARDLLGDMEPHAGQWWDPNERVAHFYAGSGTVISADFPEHAIHVPRNDSGVVVESGTHGTVRRVQVGEYGQPLTDRQRANMEDHPKRDLHVDPGLTVTAADKWTDLMGGGGSGGGDLPERPRFVHPKDVEGRCRECGTEVPEQADDPAPGLCDHCFQKHLNAETGGWAANVSGHVGEEWHYPQERSLSLGFKARDDLRMHEYYPDYGHWHTESRYLTLDEAREAGRQAMAEAGFTDPDAYLRHLHAQQERVFLGALYDDRYDEHPEDSEDESEEPCDNEWCRHNEPYHTKGEHIDPPHLDYGHPDFQSAQRGVEQAIGEHPDAWLFDHNQIGPSKYSTLHDEPEPALPSTDGASEDNAPMDEAAPGQYYGETSPLAESTPDSWPQVAPGIDINRSSPWGYSDPPLVPHPPAAGPGSADVSMGPSAEPSEDLFKTESVLEQFWRTPGFAALAAADAPATPQQDGITDADIATNARAHLAKVAAKNFSFAEQQELITEGSGKVRPRNFGDLRIEGTHYEKIGDDDPELVDEWLMF